MIKVNGETFEDKDGLTVSELISEHWYRTAFLEVELNGKIIKKDDLSKSKLYDGDKIEIVSLAGGG